MTARHGSAETTDDDQSRSSEEGLPRKTEQNDLIDRKHSIAKQRGDPEYPYAPPRQPAQDPPEDGGAG